MELLASTEPVADAAAEVPLEELRDALIDAQATISAAQARFAQALAVFRSRDGHAIGSGFPTFGHWATVDLGLSRHQTASLADAGDDARHCPELRAAWEAGELSTTKASDALGVATAETDAAWRDMAVEASSNQLRRIVQTYRRSCRAEAGSDDNSGADGDDGDQTQPATGLWWRDRSDGLAELSAILPVDDTAVVRAALEAQAEIAWRANAGIVMSRPGHSVWVVPWLRWPPPASKPGRFRSCAGTGPKSCCTSTRPTLPVSAGRAVAISKVAVASTCPTPAVSPVTLVSGRWCTAPTGRSSTSARASVSCPTSSGVCSPNVIMAAAFRVVRTPGTSTPTM